MSQELPTPKLFNIGFTGHRDRLANVADIEFIAALYPNAMYWIHGGAEGFDTQVEEVANRLSIPTVIITPQPYYKRHGKRAPLVRNEIIVNLSLVVVACYDGRPGGGTAFTVRYAESSGHFVRRLPVASAEREAY